MARRTYEISLPVFKQGDDMQGCMQEADGDSAKALILQAARYTEAARICKVLAGVAAEADLRIERSDDHIIEVAGNVPRLEALAKDDLLYFVEWDDEEPDTLAE